MPISRSVFEYPMKYTIEIGRMCLWKVKWNCTIECRAENCLLTKCIAHSNFSDVGIRVLFVWHFSIHRIQIKETISTNFTIGENSLLHILSYFYSSFSYSARSGSSFLFYRCLYFGIASRNCTCYLCFDGILFFKLKSIDL